MLLHGSTCSSFVYSTLAPIQKNRRLLLSKTDNYRAIALSNALTKILDWIFIKLEGSVLHTDKTIWLQTEILYNNVYWFVDGNSFVFHN